MTDEQRSPLKLRAMARRLGVPSTWLKGEADAGRMPHLRAGSAYLFDAESVERVVRERLRQSGKEGKGNA
jgi:hypothetical protein